MALRIFGKNKTIQNREKKIYYLDETWFDTHETVTKGWVDKSDKCTIKDAASRGKRISILHCGSNEGWVNNALLLSAKNIKDSSLDYHNDMNSENFEEWFKNKLIPNLEENSIIVMDNAPYHCRQVEKVPTAGSTKSEIKDFLIKNELFFDETYKKADLLEVLRTKLFTKKIVIEQMAKQHGHEILRLPPYHCTFNPIELIWGQLKAGVRRNNTSPQLNKEVIAVIKKEISNITSDQWSKSIDHVIDIENNYRTLINQTELVINIDTMENSRVSEQLYCKYLNLSTLYYLNCSYIVNVNSHIIY